MKVEKKALPPKITLLQMNEDVRYNTLKKESTYFMSTIKMICYRAETTLANILNDKYKKAEDEKRALIKEIIFSPEDLEVDTENNKLIITLHSLSTAMKNNIANQICEILNDTLTIFVGTNLTLFYKTIAT